VSERLFFCRAGFLLFFPWPFVFLGFYFFFVSLVFFVVVFSFFWRRALAVAFWCVLSFWKRTPSWFRWFLSSTAQKQKGKSPCSFCWFFILLFVSTTVFDRPLPRFPLIYDDDSDLVIDQDVEFHGSRLGKKKQPVTTSLVGVEECKRKSNKKRPRHHFRTRVLMLSFLSLLVVGCRESGVESELVVGGVVGAAAGRLRLVLGADAVAGRPLPARSDRPRHRLAGRAARAPGHQGRSSIWLSI